MRTTIAWVAVLFAGCAGGKDDETDIDATDTDADTDADSDSDTDADSDADSDTDTNPGIAEDFTRDILTTDLALDLTTHAGIATITLAGSTTSTSASFETGDLTIMTVEDATGPLDFVASPGQLDVSVPSSPDPAELVIGYTFADHEDFDGWSPTTGLSFLWPYFCGNLFPCKSDPADGVAFTMDVTGGTEGAVVVFPTEIPADAPSYMPAVAVGEFTEISLGTTTDGTEVKVWYLPGDEAPARAGTENMVDVIDFYEQTYGPYSFGPTVGTVEANWGPGAYGGMEHHPFWHVAVDAMSDQDTNNHEAAHGWYGDGVRIECWEDFVLSEGTVSYMAAHALEELRADDLWPSYVSYLTYVCEDPYYDMYPTSAMPPTCDAIDLLHDPLWSLIPYMKGACFYEEVADLIGADVVDQVLSDFYLANVGQAATMEEMIDALKLASPADAADIDLSVNDWLVSLECPTDYALRCGNHSRPH